MRESNRGPLVGPSYGFSEPPRPVLSLAFLAPAVATVLIGLLVIAGWLTGNRELTQLRPDFTPMVFNTALCFVLSGGALLLGERARGLAAVLSAVVSFFALITLAEYLFPLPFSIDELFLRAYVTTGASNPGRMAPLTAVCFAAAGSACLLSFRRSARAAPALVYAGAFLAASGATSVCGYLLGFRHLYALLHVTPMAAHTAVAFVLLGVALTLRCLRAADLGPWVPSWVAIAGCTAGLILWQALVQRAGPEDTGLPGTGLDLAVLLFGLSFSLLLARSIRLGYQARRFHAELERRVEERTAELREAQEELQRQVVQVEAANRELEAFTYSVSHDLRAPLRHLTGFSELLRKRAEGSLDEKGRHYLGVISGAASQMGRLVDDLLAFSRTGRVELRQEPVDFGAMVREVVEELRRDAGDRKVSWELTALPKVSGDPNLLRLVWVNLLSNALKFTGTKEEAVIRIGVEGNGVDRVFYVKDNGVGFDMQYRDKLFGLFQRLHRPEEFEGTGVGLANVARIVSRHGGKTWAEGAEGTGATFFFTLPGGGAE